MEDDHHLQEQVFTRFFEEFKHTQKSQWQIINELKLEYPRIDVESAIARYWIVTEPRPTFAT